MDKRIIKTKKNIRDTYLSMLADSSIKKISISELTRRANIDRKTFYLHYDTLDDILRELGKEQMNDIVHALEEKGFFDHPLDVVPLIQILNDVLSQDIVLFEKIARNPNDQFFWNSLEDILIKTIIDEHNHQFLTPTSRNQLIVYARYFAHGFISIYLDWLRKDIDMELNELSQTLLEASFYGTQKILALKNPE
ncbi:MAG: TetR/AcrR family transcriptional regulator [Eubacteriales bacterium]|nr:TetR/AcrR family transcriptional regulator [Eubacteriales bacterium]